ncbi:MAG: O-antigen ligase family protein [Crocinitomicaceae bacterium]|nr:O-antigen ligase family protein [Crocinitomicaceae bacterium]
MRKLTQALSNKSLEIFSVFVLVTVLFLPLIQPFKPGPGIEIIDLLVPVLFIAFFIKRKELNERNLYLLLGGFTVYIFITILVNGRWGQIRDYFEIFKMVKFILVIWLFSHTSAENFIKKWSRPIFIALVVFNLIHYFELFNFNDLLENYYPAGERIPEFGKNSIGQPTDKRMLGFPNNPNYNAIVFLFFTILFIPRKEKNIPISNWAYVYFIIAVFMVFLCQSRTSLPIIGVIVMVHTAIYIKKSWEMIVVLIMSVGLSFFLAKVISNASVDYRLAQYNKTEHMELFKYKGIIYQDSTTLLYNDYDTIVLDSIILVEDLRAYFSKSDPSFVDSLKARKTKNSYMETMLDGSAFESNSFRERLEIWRHLWNMIKKKPVFGHGPYKEYFYSNDLYSENEYILFTWRYGFIGLILYLSILIYLLIKGIKGRHSLGGSMLLYFTITLGISGLTNNPFIHQTILILLAACAGWAIYSNSQRKREVKNKSPEDI